MAKTKKQPKYRTIKESKKESHHEDESEKHESHHEDESESEKHESEDDDSDNGDGAGAGSDDGDHDDADQDIALIKKMIAQYLGKGADDLEPKETEALHSLAHEAYQAHKEMGKKEDEAFKHAGEAVKLAHHMAQKQKKESEKHESDGEDDGGDDSDKKAAPPAAKGKKPAPKAAPAAGGDDDDDDDDDGDSSESEDECGDKKESKKVRQLNQKLLEAEGRIAALEARTKKAEVDGYVDRKLKDSKQPTYITKRFREAAGKISSKTDFDSKWKVFLEGINNVRNDIDFSVMMEKSITTEDGERTSGGAKPLDFSNCAD